MRVKFRHSKILQYGHAGEVNRLIVNKIMDQNKSKLNSGVDIIAIWTFQLVHDPHFTIVAVTWHMIVLQINNNSRKKK